MAAWMTLKVPRMRFNTSITVVLTLLALILLGGETIRDFLIIMLIGLVSGTYSSIFVASQLLVSWEEGDFKINFCLLDLDQ